MKSKLLLICIAVFGLIPVHSSGQGTTADGLVGHWKFNEGSGTAVTDELSTTNGDLVNSVAGTWTTGFEGGALDFSQSSGAAAYAKFAGDGVANIEQSLSIALWVKSEMSPDGNTEYSIISKGVPNATTGGWYHLSLKDGAIRFMIWDGAILSSPAGTLPEGMIWDANTWYHIVCVRDYDAAALNVYLNGELLSTDGDGLLGSMLNDGDLTFGSVAHGETVWDSNYKGALDEVQLYNVALSAETVKSMYDAYLNPSAISNKIMDNLVIAPNPVGNHLILRNAADISELQVYNLAGALVKTIRNNRSAIIESNIELLPIGTYVLKGTRLDHSIVSRSFTKR